MVNRRELKGKHEASVLSQFGEYLSACGSNMTVLETPDPPDAIVDIDQIETWIEITDAFIDVDHARSLTSMVSDDIPHVPDARRLMTDPDAAFKDVLLHVIESKYDKNSMQKIFNANGHGILLVGVFTPYNSAENAAIEEKSSIEQLVAKMSNQIFDEIFLYDGTGEREFHRVYQRT